MNRNVIVAVSIAITSLIVGIVALLISTRVLIFESINLNEGMGVYMLLIAQICICIALFINLFFLRKNARRKTLIR